MRILLNDEIFKTEVDNYSGDYLIVVTNEKTGERVFSEWLNTDTCMLERIDTANGINDKKETVCELMFIIEFVIADLAKAYRLDVSRDGNSFAIMTPPSYSFVHTVISAFCDGELFVDSSDDDIK